MLAATVCGAPAASPASSTSPPKKPTPQKSVLASPPRVLRAARAHTTAAEPPGPSAAPELGRGKDGALAATAPAHQKTKITLPLLGGAITTRTITLFFVGSDHEARTYSMSGRRESSHHV